MGYNNAKGFNEQGVIMAAPVLQKKRGISPIWTLPLIALCIGGWLVYTSYRDAGVKCTIHFENADGITSKKTQVMYKGVALGKVEEIVIDDDLQGVNLVVMIEKEAKRSLVEDTKFWVVKPEISAGRIGGLETLLTGSYIAIQPGSSTVPARQFKGLPEPPVLPPDSPGLHISLRADALYSLQKGSPVYTKNLKIGKVKDYHIEKDNSIFIDIYIEPEFSHLIQVGTRFWNSSGVSFEGNLQSGFNLNIESLASLIYGGISCGTPETLTASSPQATNSMVFKLYKNYNSAEYGLTMTLQLASGGGIVEGKTKVLYRGLEAGVVKNIRLNNDELHTVTAEILLDPKAEPILKENTRFWIVRPEVSIEGIRHLDAIISGPYISFQPGDGAYQDHFAVQNGTMPSHSLRSGKYFTLISPDSGSLEVGAPILYKQMVVGEINKIDFGPDAESIHTKILIYEEYANQVREDSVFWNVSGVEINASLSHFNINLSSIRSMLAGGISFTTPGNSSARQTKPAEEGTTFTLYESFAKAAKNVSSLQPKGIILHLQSTADNSFDVGSPILYKNISIGEVLGFQLSEDHKKIVFEVLIHEKYAGLVNSATRFYNFSGFKIDASLSGVEVQAGPIASIVTGGISFFTPEQGEKVSSGHTFLLYEGYDAAVHKDNIQLTIHLNKAGGVQEKTKIKYQGIEIGSISQIRFSPDMEGIIAVGRVNKDTKKLFRNTTRLWLVKPAIGLSGIQHLDTILTGPYIDIIPGEGEMRTDFILLDKAPGAESYAGLNIILTTPRLGSLSKNSPVYYRQIQVGQVTGFELSLTAQEVLVNVNIHPAYASLVFNGTKFWVASGIRASWGLFSGFDFNSESMEAILAGGIAFATPEGEDMGEPAESGDHFILYEESEKTWLDWKPEMMINGEPVEIIEEEKISTAQ